MKAGVQVEIDNLEDLAAIVWNRAIVRKQAITARCPEPEDFVAAMLKITSSPVDLSRLSVQEFIALHDRTQLMEASDLQVEKSNTYSYSLRA